MERFVLNAFATACGFAAWYLAFGFICHRLEDKTIHLVILTLARFGKIHPARR
jgi:hypothetical protein